MALSAQQPEPTNDRLELLVYDAMRLWRDIPDKDVPVMIERAIVAAGSFMPTAGLVAQCWKSEKEKQPVLGAGNAGEEETRAYLAWLRKAEQEKAPPEFVERFFREVTSGLGAE